MNSRKVEQTKQRPK